MQRGSHTEKHLLAKEAHDAAQLKTFERWWISELPEGATLGEEGDGLVKAVSTGVPGIRLLEQLTGVPFKTYNATPGGNRHKIIENQTIFLARVKELGIQLTNISVEDLADGKQTLVLGLTWKLIAHFSEGMLTDAGGAELQEWLRGNLTRYPKVSVSSWGESLRDGMALCALLHAYDPRAVPNFDSLQPSDAQSNLELAFSVAKEKYGCPRLLDAADLVEGLGDEDEKVDVRSVQTYVVKLRQALRRHAEKSLEAAGVKLEELETEGAAFVDAANASASAFATSAAECSASKEKASTPDERRTAMEAAETLHQTLVDSFRAVEKPAKAAIKTRLTEGVEELLYLLSDEAKRFDHGAPLTVGGNTEAGPAVERLQALAARVNAAWVSLEAAETTHEATLLSILTYKQTDMMLAAAETECSALAAWASTRAAALKAACFEDVANVSACLTASELLATFVTELESNAARSSALDTQLAAVATRRADEGREPMPTPWRDELSTTWTAMLQAAVATRRCVGAGSKFQIEKAQVLQERWAAMEGPLAACLPTDADLVVPPPPTPVAQESGCAVM